MKGLSPLYWVCGLEFYATIEPVYLCLSVASGKYIPAIAHKIAQENLNQPKLHVNLQGVAIGDGWTNPRVRVPPTALSPDQ